MKLYTFRHLRTGKTATIGGADNATAALKAVTPYPQAWELLHTVNEAPLPELLQCPDCGDTGYDRKHGCAKPWACCGAMDDFNYVGSRHHY